MNPRHPLRSSVRGFTLVEMIVVSLLLLIAMLGLLAVFDAGARINKNETDVADAQGAVRYGIYQMTRVIRMAGSGGLYVTQAVLNRGDGTSSNGLVPTDAVFDNTSGVRVITDFNGTQMRVRGGTDMIEIRGAIFSPLLALEQIACSDGCVGTPTINVPAILGDPVIGVHVNNDNAQRPQFAAIDAYTASAAPNQPMLVLVADGDSDLHVGCSDSSPNGVQRFPQPAYNVGVLTNPTDLGNPLTPSFGSVNFTTALGQSYNVEIPGTGSVPPVFLSTPRRVGVLDDVIFFVGLLPDAQDPLHEHPFLAQGVRRGTFFQVTTLADDVEDLQIAYGVDLDGDNAVTRGAAGCPTTPNDPDPNFSTQTDCDEWRPNAPGEGGGGSPAYVATDFQSQNPFLGGHATIPPTAHCPRLRAVMVSLLAKAKDKDPTYKGPAAKGETLMNADPVAFPPVQGNIRRRVQTLKINLRNYAFQG